MKADVLSALLDTWLGDLPAAIIAYGKVLVHVHNTNRPGATWGVLCGRHGQSPRYFVIGPPKATEHYTAQELLDKGLVGMWRHPDGAETPAPPVL